MAKLSYRVDQWCFNFLVYSVASTPIDRAQAQKLPHKQQGVRRWSVNSMIFI
jgi:hypothetical protein